MGKLKQKAFWIATGDIIGRGFSFVTSIYLARTLGAEYYGLITVAISILGYATWCSDLGLINIGTRETAKKPEKRIFRVIEIFRAKIFLGVTVLILSFLIFAFVDLPKENKLVIVGYLLSLVPYMFLLEWLYSGKQEFGKITLSKGLNGLVYFLLVIFFVQSSDDVTLVPLLYIMGVSTAALVLGTFAFRGSPFKLPSRGIQLYQDLLKTSSYLGIGQFFTQIVTLLPPILIGFIISLQDAGIYGAAFKIVIIAMMLDRVFVQLFLPNLSSVWSIDKHTASKTVSTVFRFTAAGGTLIALFTALASEQIIGFLYGADYAESAAILKILSVMIAVTFINSLFSFGLIATNRDREYFAATGIGGIISGFLIVIFTAYGNILLTAIAVSLAEIIIAAFTYFRFKKVIPNNYLRPILICYSSGIMLFLILSFIPLKPIVNAFVGAILFLMIILKFNIVNKDHLDWAREKITQ
ncbi:oligosaccharide flippase family protein [Gracilimonas sp.]|uniref:oligosaccharide flippase family protein n=1 Tax=Gracilimonas sp. TaxID=1974203 RepID=UPI0028725630|nr:oligosaccharide flippase family protein [Gracilimonas sp.]